MAANANPTTVPVITAIRPASRSANRGKSITGQSGGRFLVRCLRDPGPGPPSELTFGEVGLVLVDLDGRSSRNTVKESRREKEASREQRRKIPLQRIRVQYSVNFHIAATVSARPQCLEGTIFGGGRREEGRLTRRFVYVYT